MSVCICQVSGRSSDISTYLSCTIFSVILVDRGDKLYPIDRPPCRTVLASAAIRTAEGDSACSLVPTTASAGGDRGTVPVGAITGGV